MKFRTEIKDLNYPFLLDPNKTVVLIGSCFAENIARKMHECQWNVFNGAGTLYNPMSIAKVIDLLALSDECSAELSSSIFEAEGLTHSWLFDSHFSRIEAIDLIKNVESVREDLIQSLEKSQALIVTFGTSWCYFLEGKENYIVANCHKQPQSLFSRRRVSVSEIVDLWTDLICRLTARFPDLKVIFTVSPVRHLKDGFEGNSRSKATLLLAVEELCAGSADAFYFPAYEIVCDDLRDYRFYAQDLVHPSDSAVEYIWEIFRKSFVDTRGEELIRQGNKRFKALNHRQITPR